ncbi:MAG: hypothetical protein ACPG8W_02045 [Candidatus Promineifilaceae bacterium]
MNRRFALHNLFDLARNRIISAEILRATKQEASSSADLFAPRNTLHV